MLNTSMCCYKRTCNQYLSTLVTYYEKAAKSKATQSPNNKHKKNNELQKNIQKQYWKYAKLASNYAKLFF